MKLHFNDPTFSFELLRAASYATYGGAEIGECLATAARIYQGDFESWHVEWCRTAERVETVALRALEQGRRLSAREALLRASNYFRTAEFFLTPTDPRRLVTYERSRQTFRQAMAFLDSPVEMVDIPYEHTELRGYFYTVDESACSRPTVLVLGGFDSTAEELYFFAVAAALRRGYNCLALDGPGQGAALRLQHLTARPDYEVPVRAALDYIQRRPEVDGERLAIWGTSLGGYYAARAAAFEPRLKACVVHGATYSLWEAQADKQPLLFLLAKYWPSLLKHDVLFDVLTRFSPALRWSSANGMWVFGTRTRLELLDTLRRYSLQHVASRITSPTLILHGERDQFVPPKQAAALYAALNCAKTLHLFDATEGAEEHCQMGNLSRLHQVAFDWLDAVLGRAMLTPHSAGPQQPALPLEHAEMHH